MVDWAPTPARANAELDRIDPAGSIRIERIDSYAGANPYCTRAAIICTFEIRPKLSRAAFWKGMADRLPELTMPDPFPEPDLPITAGEVAEAIVTGTARVTARHFYHEPLHGALEGEAGNPGCWIEWREDVPLLLALSAVMAGAAESLAGTEGSASERLRRTLLDQCRKSPPDFTSSLLIDAARHRDVPVLQVAGYRSLWQFGWGSRALCFWDSASNRDGVFGFQISRNKSFTKAVLHDLGLPHPASRPVGANEDFRAAAAEIGFPCAVKPISGGGGRGVTAGIADMAELAGAVEHARRYGSDILIEAHVAGSDHRLLVVEGRLVAAVRRDPPQIAGDGRRSVGALIEMLNASRQGGLRSSNYLVPVAIDAPLEARLRRAHLTLESVLARGTILVLRSNSNRSTGGTCTDVLDRVHPMVRRHAELFAAATGFHSAGIDYVTSDITASPEHSGGGFIEINATPGVLAHLAAGAEEEALGALLLGTHPSRIPAMLLLADDEASADAKRCLRERARGDPALAVAGADWAQIGATPLAVAASSPIAAATAPLRHPLVDSIAILWTRTQMETIGLPLDRFDRTVLLGASPSPAWSALIERIGGSIGIAGTPATAVKTLLHRRQPSSKEPG